VFKTKEHSNYIITSQNDIKNLESIIRLNCLVNLMGLMDEDSVRLKSEDHDQLWDKLSFDEKPIDNSEIERIIEELDTVADNGGAILKRFGITDDEGVFEFICNNSSSTIYGFFNYKMSSFLTSKEINDAVEGLETRDGFKSEWKDKEKGDIRWADNCWFSPVFTDGLIAHLLIRGGAYSEPYKNSHFKAKNLGRVLEEQIIQERYEDFLSWRIEEIQWNKWFKGIPHWDDTLILVDKEQKEIWILMFTSTD